MGGDARVLSEPLSALEALRLPGERLARKERNNALGVQGRSGWAIRWLAGKSNGRAHAEGALVRTATKLQQTASSTPARVRSHVARVGSPGTVELA